MSRTFLRVGSIFGFFSVAIGAFGAHALSLSGTYLHAWETGVHYHIAHTLAILLVGVISSRKSSPHIMRAGWFFTAGIVLFSGSLYVLAVSKAKILGAITPLGGVCFLVGWALLALAFSEHSTPAVTSHDS